MSARAPLFGILEAPPREDLFRIGAVVEALCGSGVAQVHEDITISSTGETVLRHTLGRIPKGLSVISKNAFSDIRDVKEKRSTTRMFIVASVDVVADLLIF